MKSNHLPTISVIMPSYNQAEFIQTAVESVLNQNYPHLEHLVVDAGSTDQTHSIMERYKAHSTMVTKSGLKQSQIMNHGLELAQGEIVGLLNADDIYLPGACRTVGTYFLEHPEVDMVYGDFHIIDERGDRLLTHLELDFHYPSYLFLANFIMYPTVFFRRRLCSEIGLFDTTLDYAMDYDYYLRVARHGQVQHLPKLLASYRWHPKSKSILYRYEAKHEGHVVRRRYVSGPFTHLLLWRVHCWFLWCFYKMRRMILKLVQGKYLAGPPQPFVFRLWRRRVDHRFKPTALRFQEGVYERG